MRTLDHLAAQTYPHFEVVIVNDGSTDDTVAQVERYCRDAPFKITLISQQNAGPAVARNLGIANMRTPVCVLIGDDTYPAGDFLRLHHEFHQRNTRSESIALGYTRYSEAYQRVTPLMRWLNSDGVQFAYGELIAGQPPTWHHFYTSNLSFKTAHLRRNQFNESFRYAAMEDLELG